MRIDIKNERKTLENVRQWCERSLKDAPKGTLVVHKSKDRTWFSVQQRENGSRNDCYLSKDDDDLVRQLAAKALAKKLLPVVKKELSLLNDLEILYDPTEKFKLINTSRKRLGAYIDPPLLDIDTLGSLWEKADFQRNSFAIESGSEFITAKGERVRSKGEWIIANILYSLGLHYRYEAAYSIDGKTFYPDFSIIHPKTGEIYYLEFFGMMGDTDYMTAAIKKIGHYSKAADAARFIYIFEAPGCPMSTAAIENQLKRIFFDD